MEVNLSNNPANPATPVVEVAATVTQEPAKPSPAVPGTQLPAIASSFAAPARQSFLLGDLLPDFSDMQLPRCNIVQNIGDLSQSFESGSILYGQQLVLFLPAIIEAKTSTLKRAATPPVTMTFLGFRPTRYAEKCEGGARGLLVASEEEVRANGGTLDYREWQLKKDSGMKRFEPLADCMVAIEKPEAIADDGTVFVYDVAGKKVALALWAVRGTSYTQLCKKTLFPARRLGALRHGGFPSWSYSVSSREDKYPGGHAAWVPVALPKEKSSEAFMEFVREVLPGGSSS